MNCSNSCTWDCIDGSKGIFVETYFIDLNNTKEKGFTSHQQSSKFAVIFFFNVIEFYCL